MTYTDAGDGIYICDGCNQEMDIDTLCGTTEATCRTENCKHEDKKHIISMSEEDCEYELASMKEKNWHM